MQVTGRYFIAQDSSDRKLKIIHEIEEYFNSLVVNTADDSFLCCSSDLKINKVIIVTIVPVMENDDHSSTGATSDITQFSVCQKICKLTQGWLLKLGFSEWHYKMALKPWCSKCDGVRGMRLRLAQASSVLRKG